MIIHGAVNTIKDEDLPEHISSEEKSKKNMVVRRRRKKEDHGHSNKDALMSLSFMKPGAVKHSGEEDTATEDDDEIEEYLYLPFVPVAPRTVQRIFLLFEESERSKLGKKIAAFVVFLIVASTLCFVVETEPDMKATPSKCNVTLPTVLDCEPRPFPVFFYLEAFFIACFTIEYLCRVCTVYWCPAEFPDLDEFDDELDENGHVVTSFEAVAIQNWPTDRRGCMGAFRYCTSLMNLVDFAAIFPFYLELMLSEGGGLAVLRVLRLARVFRVFKMGKYSSGMLIFGRVFVSSIPALSLLIFLSTLAIVLFGALVYFAEGTHYSVGSDFTMCTVTQQAHNSSGSNSSAGLCGGLHPLGVYTRLIDGNANPPLYEPTPFVSIPGAFWWVFTTVTTVGYGDMYPTTAAGKLIAVVLFYCGIIMVALPISILGANFEKLFEHYSDKLSDDAKGEGGGEGGNTGGGQGEEEYSDSDDEEYESTANPPPEFAEPVTQQDKDIQSSGSTAESYHPLFPFVEGPNKMQRWWFKLLEESSCCQAGQIIAFFVMGLIIVSTISFCLETMPAFRTRPPDCRELLSTGWEHLTPEACEPVPDPIFALFETACIAIFTFEYVIRMLTVHAATEDEVGDIYHKSGWVKTRRYALQPLNIIDFVAIFPFYLELLASGGGGLAVLRVLRLARVFRIFKMGKYSSGIQMFALVMSESSPALYMLAFMSLVVWIAVILFASSMYFAEGTFYLVPGQPGFPPGLEIRYPTGLYVRAIVGSMRGGGFAGEESVLEWSADDGGGSLTEPVYEPTPFLSILSAFWWCFTTMTTVGYGDVFPTTMVGQLVGVMCFYVGIMMVALPITIIGQNFNHRYREWETHHDEGESDSNNNNSDLDRNSKPSARHATPLMAPPVYSKKLHSFKDQVKDYLSTTRRFQKQGGLADFANVDAGAESDKVMGMLHDPEFVRRIHKLSAVLKYLQNDGVESGVLGIERPADFLTSVDYSDAEDHRDEVAAGSGMTQGWRQQLMMKSKLEQKQKRPTSLKHNLTIPSALADGKTKVVV